MAEDGGPRRRGGESLLEGGRGRHQGLLALTSSKLNPAQVAARTCHRERRRDPGDVDGLEIAAAKDAAHVPAALRLAAAHCLNSAEAAGPDAVARVASVAALARAGVDLAAAPAAASF